MNMTHTLLNSQLKSRQQGLLSLVICDLQKWKVSKKNHPHKNPDLNSIQKTGYNQNSNISNVNLNQTKRNKKKSWQKIRIQKFRRNTWPQKVMWFLESSFSGRDYYYSSRCTFLRASVLGHRKKSYKKNLFK